MNQPKRNREKITKGTKGIVVHAKFYCPICKGYYKEYIEQSILQAMPKYTKDALGNRRSIYLSDKDDTIIKAHKTCAEKYMNELRRRRGEGKIITGV